MLALHRIVHQFDGKEENIGGERSCQAVSEKRKIPVGLSKLAQLVQRDTVIAVCQKRSSNLNYKVESLTKNYSFYLKFVHFIKYF